MTASKITELIATLALFAGGFIWVGAVAADVETTKVELVRVKEKAEATPVNVAVLQTQMTAVQEEQKKQGEKIDRILEEVRRR